MDIIGYDIEVFPNFFSLAYIPVDKPDDKHFLYIYYDVLNDKNHHNDLLEVMKFINQKNILLGYNSLEYDDVVLKFILMNYRKFTTVKNITAKIYDFSKRIITSKKEESVDRYVQMVKRYNAPFQSMDMQKMLHLGYTRLKQVMINIKWYNVLDFEMPPMTEEEKDLYDIPHQYLDTLKPWDRYVIDKHIDDIKRYNTNDVEGLNHLFHHELEEVSSRFDISAEYGVNALSWSRSTAGAEIMAIEYEKASGIPKSVFRQWRTNRKSFKLGDIISDRISFRTNEMKKALIYFKDYVWSENAPKLAKTIMFDGASYNIGAGGLHSNDRPYIFRSIPGTVLYRDADVSSYYPNNILNNNVYPAHLGELFLTIFSRTVQERMIAKKAGLPKAAILKIVINAVFGKLNEATDFLHDIAAFFATTINGQLMLLMLIEDLYLNALHTISANTDGIVVKLPFEALDEYDVICKEWEQKTELELEYTDYEIYARLNVNNYLALKPDGKVKRKGQLNRNAPWEDMSKGYNMPIIPHAVEQALMYGVPIEKTITNHNDIYDFMASQKMGQGYVAELHTFHHGKTQIEPVPANFRYVISKSGGVLYKRKDIHFGGDNKLTNLRKGQRVKIVNFVDVNKPISEYNIHYGYYISEAQKLLDIMRYSLNIRKKKNKAYTNYAIGGLFQDMDF